MKLHNVSNLYFKYIKDSNLDHTVESLSEYLERQGLIKVTLDRTHYEELPKFKCFKDRESFLQWYAKQLKKGKL